MDEKLLLLTKKVRGKIKVIVKIAALKKKFKNTWVLAEVLKKNELNQPVEVKPIMTSKDRDTIYKKLGEQESGKLYATLYTGKITGAFILLLT